MAAPRQPNDHYPTPGKLAWAITQRLGQLVPAVVGVVEPSAGTGGFIRASRHVWPGAEIIGVDVDPAMQQPMLDAGADFAIIADWLDVAAYGLVPGVLVLGNPPFGQARPHIEASIRALCTGDHAAYLLRMGFMGSRKRVDFWKRYPARYLVPLVPRPNFLRGKKGKSGDNSEYGVFVWQKGYHGPTEVLETLVWD